MAEVNVLMTCSYIYMVMVEYGMKAFIPICMYACMYVWKLPVLGYLKLELYDAIIYV